MNLMWKKVSYDFTLRVRPPTHRSSKVTRRVADEANHLAREALTPEKCEHPYVNSLENLDSINAIDFTLLLFFDDLTIARCMTDGGRTFTSPVKTHKLLEFSPDGARWPRRGAVTPTRWQRWPRCVYVITVWQYFDSCSQKWKKGASFQLRGGGGGGMLLPQLPRGGQQTANHRDGFTGKSSRWFRRRFRAHLSARNRKCQLSATCWNPRGFDTFTPVGNEQVRRSWLI